MHAWRFAGLVCLVGEWGGEETGRQACASTTTTVLTPLTQPHTHTHTPTEQVCVECVGYLLEELRNPETLEEMRKDVESADIFIGSLIFIQVR